MSSHPAPSSRRASDRNQVDRFRLGHTGHRFVLLAHLAAALGWLGIDVIIGVLAVTGFIADDPARVAASYIALDMFAAPLLLIFGLATLASGLLLSLGSRWGVLKHWWVVAKLLINLVLTGLVLVLLQPRLNTAAAQATRIDTTLRERLGGIPTDLLFPAFVSGVALLIAALLATFKPRGRTPLARRPAVSTGADRAESGTVPPSH